MRKTLMSLTALAALAGAGLISNANAAPAPTQFQGAHLQTVQYYYGRPGGDWRWREHERWRRRHHWHRWHHHRGW